MRVERAYGAVEGMIEWEVGVEKTQTTRLILELGDRRIVPQRTIYTGHDNQLDRIWGEPGVIGRPRNPRGGVWWRVDRKGE